MPLLKSEDLVDCLESMRGWCKSEVASEAFASAITLVRIHERTLAIDAGSVVRCNKCMHWRQTSDHGGFCSYGVPRPTRPDYYCADGAEKGEAVKEAELKHLTRVLRDFFDIGDSYTYQLQRVDWAELEVADFKCWTMEEVEELAGYLVENGVSILIPEA